MDSVTEKFLAERLGKQYLVILSDHLPEVKNPWNSLLVAVSQEIIAQQGQLTNHLLFDLKLRRMYFIPKKQPEVCFYQEIKTKNLTELLEQTNAFISRASKIKFLFPLFNWPLPVPPGQQWVEYDLGTHQSGQGYRKPVLAACCQQWGFKLLPVEDGQPADLVGWLELPGFDYQMGISLIKSIWQIIATYSNLEKIVVLNSGNYTIWQINYDVQFYFNQTGLEREQITLYLQAVKELFLKK